jgi:hypothetical protein
MRKAVTGAVVLVLTSLVLGATVLREPLARAAAPIASVFVTNDSANPVPVREQNVDASGSVKVHEQGTAAVRSANEEFAVTKNFSDNGPSCIGTLLTVPAGKQLVVEWVGAVLDSSANLPLGYLYRVGGTPYNVVFTFQHHASGTAVASQPVHYTYPPGSEIRADFFVPLATSCNVYVSLGGYYQPAL